jgi:hypothetical protein
VIAYVGAADRSVAHSLIAAAALSASPPAHRPVEEIRVEAEAFAELHGGAVVLLEGPAKIPGPRMRIRRPGNA